MSRCKQCHMDGHHKMSCTDEANTARKDRVTVRASRTPAAPTAPADVVAEFDASADLLADRFEVKT